MLGGRPCGVSLVSQERRRGPAAALVVSVQVQCSSHLAVARLVELALHQAVARLYRPAAMRCLPIAGRLRIVLATAPTIYDMVDDLAVALAGDFGLAILSIPSWWRTICMARSTHPQIRVCLARSAISCTASHHAARAPFSRGASRCRFPSRTIYDCHCPILLKRG